MAATVPALPLASADVDLAGVEVCQATLWLESVGQCEERMNQYIHLRQKARDGLELRHEENIDPGKNRWELCSRVLARKDVVEKLSESW